MLIADKVPALRQLPVWVGGAAVNQGSQTGSPSGSIQPTGVLCLACRVIPKSGQFQ